MRFVKVYFKESMGSKWEGKTVPFNIKNKENKQNTERKIFQENAKKVKELLNNYNSLDSLIKDDTKKGWKVKMELLNNNVITGSDCTGVVNVDNWKENYREIKDSLLKDFKEQLGKYFSDDELKEFLLKEDKNGMIACNPINLLEKLKDRGFSEEQVQKILFATASLKQNQTLKELFKYNITVDDLKKGKLTKKLNSLSKENKAKATELVRKYLMQKRIKEFEKYFFGIYVDDMPNSFFLLNEEFIGKIEKKDKLIQVLKKLKEQKKYSFSDIEVKFRKYLASKFYSSFETVKEVYNIFAKKGEKISYLFMVQNIDFYELSNQQKEEFLSMVDDDLLFYYTFFLEDLYFVKDEKLKKRISKYRKLLDSDETVEDFDLWSIETTTEDLKEIVKIETTTEDLKEIVKQDNSLLEELKKFSNGDKSSRFSKLSNDELRDVLDNLVNNINYLPKSFDFIKKTPALLQKFLGVSYKFYQILPDILQKKYNMSYLSTVISLYKNKKDDKLFDDYSTARELASYIKFDDFNSAYTILGALLAYDKTDNTHLLTEALKRPLFKKQLASIFKKPESKEKIYDILYGTEKGSKEMKKFDKEIIKQVMKALVHELHLSDDYYNKTEHTIKNLKKNKVDFTEIETKISGEGFLDNILQESGLEDIKGEKKEKLLNICKSILDSINKGVDTKKIIENLYLKLSYIFETPEKFGKFVKGLERELVKFGMKLKNKIEKTKLKENESKVLKNYTFEDKEGKKHTDLSKLSKDYQDFVRKYHEKHKNEKLSKENLIELFLQSKGITDKSIRKNLYQDIRSYLVILDITKFTESVIKQGENNGWKKVMEDIQKGDFSAIEEDYYNSYFSLDKEYESIQNEAKQKQEKLNKEKLSNLPQDDPINILYGENNKENNDPKVLNEEGGVYTVKNPFAKDTDPTIEEEITGTKEEVNKQLLSDSLLFLGLSKLENGIELPQDIGEIEKLTGLSISDKILSIEDIRKFIDHVAFSIIYKFENKKIKNFSLKDRLNEDMKKIKMGDKTAISDLFEALNDNMDVLKQIQLADATETKFLATNLESFDNLDFVKYKEKYS